MERIYSKPQVQVKIFDDVVTLGDDTMWYSFPGDDFVEDEPGINYSQPGGGLY